MRWQSDNAVAQTCRLISSRQAEIGRFPRFGPPILVWQEPSQVRRRLSASASSIHCGGTHQPSCCSHPPHQTLAHDMTSFLGRRIVPRLRVKAGRAHCCDAVASYALDTMSTSARLMEAGMMMIGSMHERVSSSCKAAILAKGNWGRELGHIRMLGSRHKYFKTTRHM